MMKDNTENFSIGADCDVRNPIQLGIMECGNGRDECGV